MSRLWSWSTAPLAAAALLFAVVAWTFAYRVAFPYDLEWMEGGMLAHAWRLDRGLPLYTPPTPDWAPYIYPPGYPLVLVVLGKVFGLSPALGRAVSIAATFLASGSLAAAVRWMGGDRVLQLCVAVCFLGLFPQTGGFYDLVRPDSVAVGLLGWALALGLTTHRRSAAVAGGLVFCAFLAKHNAAAFGLPLLITFWWRDGWKVASQFAATSVLPALATIGWLQVQSDGAFLTYLLRVPTSHPSFIGRVWPTSFKEIGTALPIGLACIGATLLWLANLPTSRVPRAVSAIGPVVVGTTLAAIGTYEPVGPDSYVSNEAAGVAFFVVTTLPLTAGAWWLGRERGRLPWEAIYAGSLALVALPLSASMRAHNGGFLNVHIPLLYVLTFGFGASLVAAVRTFPALKNVAYVALTLQLAWSAVIFHPTRFVPTAADYAAGDRFVAAAKAAPGPVLSPWAAWIPVYAGKEPSLHYMGLWDLEYPDGPYLTETQVVRDAVEARRWAAIFPGNEPFPYDILVHYQLEETILKANDPALMPKTGYRVRPERVLVPRPSEP